MQASIRSRGRISSNAGARATAAGSSAPGWDERAEFILAEIPLIEAQLAQGDGADWADWATGFRREELPGKDLAGR